LSIPRFITATTLCGKALKIVNASGKCFQKCPAASIARMGLSQRERNQGYLDDSNYGKGYIR
jgi:hypothetical protein